MNVSLIQIKVTDMISATTEPSVACSTSEGKKKLTSYLSMLYEYLNN
jgi:hypothetical protein